MHDAPSHSRALTSLTWDVPVLTPCNPLPSHNIVLVAVLLCIFFFIVITMLTRARSAEIKAEDQAITPKRRSIFRSAGTASTPDLSTLIRGNRKQSGKQQTAKEAAKHPMPSYTERASSLTSHLSTSTSSLTRNRPQPHVSPRMNDREPLPGTGSAMTTIAEGPIEYHPPPAPSIDDNGKVSRQ